MYAGEHGPTHLDSVVGVRSYPFDHYRRLQCCLMPLLDNSSISDITNVLEEIARQRRCIRILHADNNAAEIAGCRKKLKACIDSFVVGILVVVRRLTDP